YYFKRTWLAQFKPKIWNLYDILQLDVIVRTKAILKTIIVTLNEYFANTHPNYFAFIPGIEKVQFYPKVTTQFLFFSSEMPGYRLKHFCFHTSNVISIILGKNLRVSSQNCNLI
ncbi:hypothetical protein MXB_4108, partial [Myxobolus squamalis]